MDEWLHADRASAIRNLRPMFMTRRIHISWHTRW